MTDRDKRIDEIMELDKARTQGSWYSTEDNIWNIEVSCNVQGEPEQYQNLLGNASPNNAAFIAKAPEMVSIISELQAELAARDWHDISAAPKDGTHLLITDGKQIDIGWFGADWNIDSKGEWLRGDGDDFSTGYYFTPCKPTHFQYLPQPPVITKQGD